MGEPERKPALILGFWEMGIIGTLMVVFFPWSLLFCLFVYGMDDTKALILALVHDAVKTILAILAILVPTIIVVSLIIVMLVSSYS